MADNVTINASSGTEIIATDEVVDADLGTVQVQFIKVMDGTLGSTYKASVNPASGLIVEDPRLGSQLLEMLEVLKDIRQELWKLTK